MCMLRLGLCATMQARMPGKEEDDILQDGNGATENIIFSFAYTVSKVVVALCHWARAHARHNARRQTPDAHTVGSTCCQTPHPTARPQTPGPCPQCSPQDKENTERKFVVGRLALEFLQLWLLTMNPDFGWDIDTNNR